MMSKGLGILVVAAAVLIAAGMAYAAGYAAGRSAPATVDARSLTAQPAQAPRPDQSAPPAPAPGQIAPPGQTPNLREFVPLPFPGDQNPGQRPGQQQGDCEPIILFYHNGRLYQLQPGPGDRNGNRPGVPPEFYQLNPYQGPPIPGLPFPRQDRGPGFIPLNPRS
ncbi:MAG: hypothetical protein ACRDIC_00480 [bacterium]